jgi:hypothetical protein
MRRPTSPSFATSAARRRTSPARLPCVGIQRPARARADAHAGAGDEQRGRLPARRRRRPADAGQRLRVVLRQRSAEVRALPLRFGRDHVFGLQPGEGRVLRLRLRHAVDPARSAVRLQRRMAHDDGQCRPVGRAAGGDRQVDDRAGRRRLEAEAAQDLVRDQGHHQGKPAVPGLPDPEQPGRADEHHHPGRAADRRGVDHSLRWRRARSARSRRTRRSAPRC